MKKIPLTNCHLFALVDDQDYELVSQFKWRLAGKPGRPKYAQASYKRLTVLMHKLILPRFRQIDHRDRDGLNNRRANLRPCNHGQNRANAIKRKGRFTSPYKGVFFKKSTRRWQASIGGYRTRKYLGSFACEREAAQAYNQAALILYGQFARLNIIKGVSA